MSRLFGWEYPPGVTGREPQITGDAECPECGSPLTYDEGWKCDHCGWEE